MSKPPPLICEKCHRVRLHPVRDKGHRWCKKCREKGNARLTTGQPDTPPEPPLTADEKRLARTVYGKYCKYDFEATANLLRTLRAISVIERCYANRWTYWRIKHRRPHKKR